MYESCVSMRTLTILTKVKQSKRINISNSRSWTKQFFRNWEERKRVKQRLLRIFMVPSFHPYDGTFLILFNRYDRFDSHRFAWHTRCALAKHRKFIKLYWHTHIHTAHTKHRANIFAAWQSEAKRTDNSSKCIASCLLSTDHRKRKRVPADNSQTHQ